MRNPGYVADPRVSAGPLAQPVPAQAGLAAGLAQFAGALEKSADAQMLALERREERRRQIDTLKAVTGAREGLAAIEMAAEEDTDWRTAPERAGAAIDAVLKAHRGGLKDELSQATFDSRIGEGAIAAFRGVQKRAREAERKEALAAYETLEAQNLTRAAGAADPEARRAILEETGGALTMLRDQGQLDPVEAGQRLRGFRAKSAEQEAQALITADPEAASAALADPRRFPDLPGERREIWARQAATLADTRLRARIAAEDRADRLAERALRRRGDQAAKDLDTLEADGALTREAIEARRTELAPGEYRHFLGRLDPKAVEVKSDIPTYAGFERRIDTPEAFDAFASDIAAEEKAGRLANADARALLDKKRAALRDDAPASPYRSGRGFISTALDPGQFGADPATRQPFAMAQSAAFRDFDAWARANPGADAEAAYARAEQIVGRYQATAWGEMRIALPRPYGFVGPKGDVAAKDLLAAAGEIRRRRQAGELTEAEAAEEYRRLDLWERLLARQPAPAPSKGGR